MKLVDLTGQRFGRAVAISCTNRRRGYGVWLCMCDCGKQFETLSSCLKQGEAKSCGCFKRDTLKKIKTTHGHAPTGKPSRTYRIWRGMHTRCENPNHKDWPYYGARGIRVCKRWFSFTNFLADMGEAPDTLTLERMNNDKGYYLENCGWMSRKEQRANQRVPSPRYSSD